MGLLLLPAEGFGLWPRLFCPSGKKGLIMQFCPILGHCWCSIVPLVTFCNNPKNPNISKKFFLITIKKSTTTKSKNYISNPKVKLL